MVVKKEIIRVRDSIKRGQIDSLAVEEPLEIRISYNAAHGVYRMISVAVTMRTPGQDEELVRGFLFSERIIEDLNDIELIEEVETNIVHVRLDSSVSYDADKHQRNFFVSSSCGVCGKASISQVESQTQYLPWKSTFSISGSALLMVPQRLRDCQRTFATTGGIHACALVDSKGQVVVLREDVGRHNALDKLIGSCVALPIYDFMVALSGRASFELVQKAVISGVGMVAAIGAPSSLAVELAEAHGVTLVGFLKDTGYNIYCGSDRVLTDR